MSILTDSMLEMQHARTSRARSLMAESDAALAKAEEAKARLTMVKMLETGAPLAYPRTRTNLLAEWEYWTVEARRLHAAASDVLLGR